MKRILIVSAMLMAAFGSAEAVIVFSNFDLVNYDERHASGITQGQEYAERFVTTENPYGAWDVNEIKIMAGKGHFGNQTQANINIYRDGSNDVGVLIYQLLGVTVTMDNSWYAINSYTISGLRLDAGATYWVGLEALAWPPVAWMRTANNYPGSPDFQGGPVQMGSGKYNGMGHVFEMGGTQVPEPTTLAMLGLAAAIACIAAMRRRS